ncbi:serpin family protein [Actinokineospora auranticolor]|uniref:Serpin B n=1 Tax=Actinokineospora auranticolor TaxID=155976 RepID=A0A2S6GVA1_9PSEU|nr:serpin family protein [Actinokineospora auranticolor]PPK69144.1 serpin B [Actinokineospora auranticolor]
MSHLGFTLDLHRAVASDPAQQVCWSPFSVASALTLLARGAKGASLDELAVLLGELGETGAELGAAGSLEQPRPDEEQPVIAVANTLWADASVPIESGFAEELASWSGGVVRNAPFRAEPEKARREINADVAETTRGLIPELVPFGTFTADTVSSLVNALYLKCAWHNRFTPTTPLPFATAGRTAEVPAMSLNERIGYAHRDGWQVVGLPAVGGVEAVILLPDEELAESEAALTAGSLSDLLSAPEPRQVQLALPKLEITTRADLTAPLREVGVRTVFTDSADLTGISSERLAVQRVLHESVLKVDEDGFEGAAATAVVMRMVSLVQTEVEVEVNRPFLVVVRHKGTGVIYFLARVTDPS